MKIYKKYWAASMLLTLLGTAGCNTISFFPGKAAEFAADNVIGDILGRDATNSSGTLPPLVTPATPSTTSAQSAPAVKLPPVQEPEPKKQ